MHDLDGLNSAVDDAVKNLVDVSSDYDVALRKVKRISERARTHREARTILAADYVYEEREARRVALGLLIDREIAGLALTDARCALEAERQRINSTPGGN